MSNIQNENTNSNNNNDEQVISVSNSQEVIILPVKTYKTVDHLSALPIVQQTDVLLNDFAGTRVIMANVKPLVRTVFESRTMGYISPVTNALDTVSNSSLVVAEKIAPSIKTKTYQRLGEEAMIPCRFIDRNTRRISKATHDFTERNIITPGHNQLLNWRKYYNQYINTNNQPLIRSRFDIPLLHWNNFFEDLTHRFLPEGEAVPKDGHCCEFNRGVVLAANFGHRSVDAALKDAQYLVMLPCRYISHVNTVVNKELDQQPTLGVRNSARATWDAMRKLEKEALNRARHTNPVSWLRPKKNHKTTQATQETTIVSQPPIQA